MFKTLLLASTVLLSLHFAKADWIERGNGGFLLRCGTELRALDLYEAEDPERFGLTLDRQHLTDLKERFYYLLTKFAQHNPSRAQLYKQWFESFNSEAEFMRGRQLDPIGDTGLVKPPKNCSLEQVIFQRAPNSLNKYRYIVNLDLWEQLRPIDQAAMILHELIYRELTLPPMPHLTSEGTRALNGWMNSTASNNVSIKEYLQVLQGLHIISAEYHGMPILLAAKNKFNGTWDELPLSFHENGTPHEMTLAASFKGFDEENFTLVPQCQPNKDSLLTMGTLRLTDSGQILSLTSFNPSGNSYVDGGLKDAGKPWFPVASCRSLFNHKKNNFSVTGDNWFLAKGNLYSVDGFYMPPPYSGITELVLQYKDWRIETMSDLPLKITIDFDQTQNLKRLSFVGKACKMRDYRKIYVWKESPLDPAQVWTPQSLEKSPSDLPSCTRP